MTTDPDPSLLAVRGKRLGGPNRGQRARPDDRACAGDVSSTVKDLVAGSGIVLADRGERELKGVGGWRLYSVVPANKVEEYSFLCDVLSPMHVSLTVTP